MISVGCCRCMRLMDPNGKPVGDPVLHGGIMDLQHIMLHFAALKDTAAVFPSKEAADAAAQHFGWMAVDGNHRCPGCVAVEKAQLQKAVDDASPYAGMIERSGCYIDWGELQMDGPEA